MPENKICKSSILNYTYYCCLQLLIFFMPFQEYLIQKERYAFKIYLLKIK